MEPKDLPSPKARDSAQWAEIISAAKLSGQSLAKFARAQGISVHLLYYWRARLKIPQDKAAKPPTFIPVHIVPPPSELKIAPKTFPVVEIVIPNGRIVRVIGDVDLKQFSQIMSVIDQGSHSC